MQEDQYFTKCKRARLRAQGLCVKDWVLLIPVKHESQ